MFRESIVVANKSLHWYACLWPLFSCLALLHLTLRFHALQLHLQTIVVILDRLLLQQLGLQGGQILFHLTTSRRKDKSVGLNVFYFLAKVPKKIKGFLRFCIQSK